MVIGSLIVAMALMFIGWTQEIVYSLVDEKSPTSLTLKKSLAVVSFYLLDFAINAIQASCRALIVDSLSTSQQEEGTAWAGRMIGIGGVAGYFMGFIDLPAIFPFLGGTQLQVLCALASIILLSSIGITCWTISEKVLQRSEETKNPLVEAFEVLATIIKSFQNLPRTVRLLCTTQFFAWIGWFPFLFYATVWVSEVYNNSSSSSSSSNSGNVVVVGNGDDNEEDKLGDSTRIGSLTLLIYSIVSMMASIVLPFLVNPSDSSSSTTALSNSSATITSKIFRLPIPWLTLPRLWTISHFIFGGSMLLTLFVTEVYQADFLFSIVGISWAVSMWAPFSILGEVISSQSRLSLNSDNYDGDGDESYEVQEMSYKPVKSVKVEEDEEDVDYHDTNDTNDNNIDSSDNNNNDNSSSRSNGKIIIDNNNDDDIDNNDNDTDNEINNINNDNNNTVFTDAGIILGIHNIFVVVPQFLVTFISSVIFAILESNNNDGGGRSDSIGFMLRFGGIMAIFAGFLSIRLWK